MGLPVPLPLSFVNDLSDLATLNSSIGSALCSWELIDSLQQSYND